MSTRSLGNLVVRLALELAQYKAGWQEAEAATKDGAAKIDQANKGAAQGSDALKDALKRQTGAYGEAAGAAADYAQVATATTCISTGLAVGLGAVAVAAGAAAYAVYQGAKEQQALNNSLLLTGNYAGLVSGQLDQMALSVASSIGGTVGNAREVLAGLVGTGRFTVESLGEVGQAVQLVAQYSGRTNAQVLKDFAGMADGVAKWAAKSNEAYHFLSIEQYRHIRALEEQGRAQEAMVATADALSEHLKGNLTQNLGYLERAWLGVTAAASKAWAAMKDLGKDQGIDAQIDAVAQRLENAKRGLAARSASGQDAIAAQETELRTLLRRKEILESNAQAQTANAQASEKAIAADQRADKIAEQYATTSERKRDALKEVRKVAEEAGKSAEWLADQEAKINKHFAEKQKKGPMDPHVTLMKSAAEYNAMLELELGATEKVTEAEKRRAKYQADVAAGYIKYNAVAYDAYMLELDEIEAKEKAIRLKAEDLKQTKEAAKEYADSLEAIEKRIAQTHAETEKLQLHTAALGLTKVAAAELTATKLEDQAASKDRLATLADEIDWSGKLGDAYRREAEALRKQAQAKREGAAKEEFVETLKKEKEAWNRFVDDIDKTFHDGYSQMLQHGEDGWNAWTKSLKNTFKTTVADEIYKMFGKPLAVNVIGQMFGGGPQLAGNSPGLGSLLSNGQSAFNVFNGGYSGMTAPGGMYYNFATSGIGQSMGLSNSAAIIGNNPSAYAPAGTQLTGGGGMGSLGYGAGAAATIAVIAYAAKEAWQSTRGERRGGGRFDWDPTGGSRYTNGPDGDRAEGSDDVVKSLLATTAASLNDTFKSFGSDLTVAALTGAYETSANSRGGVFSGGRLSSGARFGEDGSGTNYGWTGPLDSKYEMWQAYAVGGHNGGMRGALDLNGDPAKLAVDMQQSYIAAIQASAGIIPRIVREEFKTQGEINFGGTGENMELGKGMVDGWRWLRVYDAELKDRARELGLLPKRILDLIIDVDPEALSAEATAALTAKIGTLVTNVNGFRAIVDALPVERLRAASFDIAAGLVELSGGLEIFGGNLATYVENFYSAEEKRAFTVGNIAKTLQAGGLNFSEDLVAAMTREQFRAVADSLDISSEAGQRMYATMMSVAGAFAGITEAAGEMGAARDNLTQAFEREADSLQSAIEGHRAYARELREFRDGLLLGAQSPLDVFGRRREAERQFAATLAGAQSGDMAAREGLTGASGNLLAATLASARTKTEYDATFARVSAALTIEAASADSQASVGEQQLGVMESQLEALGLLNDSVLSFADAFAAYTGTQTALEAAKVSQAQAAAAAIEAANLAQAQAAAQAAAAAAQAQATALPSLGAVTEAMGGSALSLFGSGLGTGYLDLLDPNSPYSPFNPANQYAAGGDFAGGLRLVGERGPELEVTGPSRIFSAAQTRDILQGGGGNQALLAELQALRRELARQQHALEAIAQRTYETSRNTGELKDRGVQVLPARSGENLTVSVAA
jgi:phage-related minor tail protein